jgi:hypothetical protein
METMSDTANYSDEERAAIEAEIAEGSPVTSPVTPVVDPKDEPKAKKPKATKTLIANVRLTVNGERVNAGEKVVDVPAKTKSWLLEGGYVSEKEAD